jgi:hypothetical protein
MIPFAWALALAAPAPADGAFVSSYDPPSLVRYMQREGYKATLKTDSLGDPMIESGSGGTTFLILFYNCKEHRQCADVGLQTGYDFAAGKEPPFDTINDYNRGFRFTRSWLDQEKDPLLQMDLIFTEGRMPETMFGEQLDVWADAMADFEKHVGW